MSVTREYCVATKLEAVSKISTHTLTHMWYSGQAVHHWGLITPHNMRRCVVAIPMGCVWNIWMNVMLICCWKSIACCQFKYDRSREISPHTRNNIGIARASNYNVLVRCAFLLHRRAHFLFIRSHMLRCVPVHRMRPVCAIQFSVVSACENANRMLDFDTYD